MKVETRRFIIAQRDAGCRMPGPAGVERWSAVRPQSEISVKGGRLAESRIQVRTVLGFIHQIYNKCIELMGHQVGS